VADEPLTTLQAAFMEVVRPTPAGRAPRAAHVCLRAAVVVDGDRRVWYPCRSHADGKHHFAAHWPPCPAPWCRLPTGHRELHDIPSGTVEYHDTIEAVR
jgi:hypothetical protein